MISLYSKSHFLPSKQVLCALRGLYLFEDIWESFEDVLLSILFVVDIY